MLRVLLNYLSPTIHFGRYLESKTRLRLLFCFSVPLVLSLGVPAWAGGIDSCSSNRDHGGRPDPTGILPATPGNLPPPSNCSDISKKMCLCTNPTPLRNTYAITQYSRIQTEIQILTLQHHFYHRRQRKKCMLKKKKGNQSDPPNHMHKTSCQTPNH